MRALILLLVSTTSYFASFQLLAGEWESNFIEAVKSTKASTLENKLPDIIVSEWVKSTFEKGSDAKWIINDCGEGSRSGNPRTPTCVEIQIPQNNGYYLHISSIIGVTSDQIITKPHFWMVYFYKAEGYKTIDVINVKTIEEAVSLYKTNLGEK